MARFGRQYNQSTIDKFDKEGRGQGELTQYLPWLKVYDVPSIGRSWIVRGWKTGREHHLLSDLEYKFFLVAEWSNHITDIREQYPLRPLEVTEAIATEMGGRHPIHPRSRLPWVMTTDFLLTLRSVSDSTIPILHARTCKYAKELISPSTMEKFEIERRFWEKQGVDWGIVTERDIPTTLAHNVQILHQSYFLPEFQAHNDIADIAHALSDLLRLNLSQPLRWIGRTCDEHLGYQRGTSLQVAYYLMATKQWRIDMHQPLNPSKPLNVLKVMLSV